MHTLLIVDDEKSIRDSIKLSLMGEPYKIIETGDLDEAYSIIEKHHPDLMLLDIHFPEEKTSSDLLRKLSDDSIHIPTIILSGAASTSEAVEAIKLGAYDYLEKPASLERLKVSLTRCIEANEANQKLENLILKPSIIPEIIGESDEIKEVKQTILKLAPKPIKVLITGETGTGKELIAQALWKNSKLSKKPFIAVNLAAIPENLIESELFGHKKGAFTGAVSNQIGKIEMADGGTIFLDEIGELSQQSQTKLLRFLENNEIQPLGSSASKKVNVRVIAATSRDIELEVKKELFRSDLYYRLNVGRVSLPALRHRRDDISTLFKNFVAHVARRYEEPEKLITDSCLKILKSYKWPGNIRELKNIAERSVLMSGPTIDDTVLKDLGVDWAIGETNTEDVVDITLTLKEYRNKMERDYIIKVIRHHKGSIIDAARQLELDRSYLHQKMNQLGIRKDDL